MPAFLRILKLSSKRPHDDGPGFISDRELVLDAQLLKERREGREERRKEGKEGGREERRERMKERKKE